MHAQSMGILVRYIGSSTCCSNVDLQGVYLECVLCRCRYCRLPALALDFVLLMVTATGSSGFCVVACYWHWEFRVLSCFWFLVGPALEFCAVSSNWP